MIARWLVGATLFLSCCSGLHAGLHYSAETYRPLPARWRGFLADLRALRAAAASQTTSQPVRDTYAKAALELEAKLDKLTADETADLGAIYVRIGVPRKALDLLRPAAHKYPNHFRIASNLGAAWHAQGDWEQASAALEDAVRLAPDDWKEIEKYHAKLMRLRLNEGKDGNLLPDDLFGIKFIGKSGKAEPGRVDDKEKTKLPKNALAIVQQLSLWFPSDGRLLWQLGEVANAYGDVRAAANILDGCVTEYGMTTSELRARRQIYRAAVEELYRREEHVKGVIDFASNRPLTRIIDPARLPQIADKGVNTPPWVALTETEFDSKGRAKFLKYVEDLDGKRVSFTGFIAPRGQTRDKISNLLLTENQIGCWFCETPGPTQTLSIELAEGIKPTREQIRIVGIFRVNKTDPETYPFRIVEAKTGLVE